MNQIQPPRPGGGARRRSAVLPRGHQLGAFTIDGVFGRGGFGVTYLAHDPQGAAVAIKSLDATPSEQSAASFRREAEILGQLRHPNIVGLRHFEPAGDLPYLVLDHPGGRSLADALAAGMGIPELRPLLNGILDALDHVHGAGFLHRDVKPGNILLDHAGTPMLADFGAAWPIGAAMANCKSVATPGYGALEQFVEDGTEGPWTDLYGLAAIAYRLVTGSAPPPALERAEGAELKPAAGTANGNYPDAVLKAIDWGLDLAVHRRPQSAAEWRSALSDAWSTAGVEGAGPTPAPAGSPAAIIAASQDDYPPTEEITRVTPPPRPSGRKVPLDLPVAPRSPASRPAAHGSAKSDQGGGTGWIWAVVGVALLAGVAAGGYFVGWPYYLRNIKSEWLVDAAGGGDVRTITEALETAKEGALIEVRPGTYPESLTIVRPVTLTGLEAGADGPTVIVASEAGACLTASGASVIVSGFFFQGGAPADGVGIACIDLRAGTDFQGNHVDATGRPAMHVGGGADPVVAGNTLTATAAPALRIDSGGLGWFRDNVIGSADRPGIVVSGAAPVIEANTLESTGLAGIVYDGAAAGRLADNAIRQAGASGIEVRGKSNPEIVGNRIEAAGQAGIFVFEGGHGRIEGNTITGSAFSGVVVGSGGKPTLTGNTISENTEHGVLMLSGGAGVLRSNTIERNGGFGIAMEKDVSVSRDANILSGNRDPQIRSDGVVRPFPVHPEAEADGEIGTGDTTGSDAGLLPASDPATAGRPE